MTAEEIIFDRRGGLGVVRLNRPKALNTLSLAMYRKFDPQLVAWGVDPAVHAIVVMGEGGRAFCAGGNVRAIYDTRTSPTGTGDYKTDFFREEYLLISRVHRFPKPYVALMDGIVMGGGAGIAVNGSHRVATEKTLFAMPEVHIGLFPDVGASRFLNLCPGRLGLYLALTGRRIGAADALYCGFATHYVASAKLPALIDALSAVAWEAGNARAQVDAVLERFAGDAGTSTLAGFQQDIDRVFAARSVEAIVATLDRETSAWATEAREAIARASPISLKVTFHQLQLGKGMSVEEALTLEYRLTQHVMAGHDFFEGIRALLVEKDNAPKWQHAALAEVSAAEVAGYFKNLGARELHFS
ncbi:MAG: enoyl-CoA hydratase/isomerase family protein [Alphaproteobacteria bacterium]|nr:enoyl-CoA hydratase/isomerase family protein [Alphaproteobacteria bacterium]